MEFTENMKGPVFITMAAILGIPTACMSLGVLCLTLFQLGLTCMGRTTKEVCTKTGRGERAKLRELSMTLGRPSTPALRTRMAQLAWPGSSLIHARDRLDGPLSLSPCPVDTASLATMESVPEVV
jgi:hypothetical protein